MAHLSWFRRWLRSWIRPQVIKPLRKRKSRSLNLEHLETRINPTTFTWKGGAAGGNDWSIGANWVGGSAPSLAAGAINDLVFSTAATVANRITTDDMANLVVHSITISNITAGQDYTLNGSLATTTIILGSATSGGGNITLTSAPNELISLNIKLGGTSSTFSNTISVGIASELTISGHLTGNSDLISNGVGTAVLSADNSGGGVAANGFNGPVDIRAGILSIQNNNALGNSAAANKTTTVETNATLQLDSSTAGFAGPVAETLLVNGPGSTNVGALLFNNGGTANSATWKGTITMDSNTTIGAIGTGTGKLTISGVIGDNSTGHNLVKEGVGTIILSAANTYRGNTTINNGVIVVQNDFALGHAAFGNTPSNADDLADTGTAVNTSPLETGTLELDGANAPGGSLTITNQLLTITTPTVPNPGNQSPDGTVLDNISGNNSWDGDIVLGGPPPEIPDFAEIGVEGTTTLTVNGVPGAVVGTAAVTSPNGTTLLEKFGTGTLVFTTANSYAGGTDIFEGVLEIEDSEALGTAAAVVESGASLELSDDFRRANNSPDSITGTTNHLTVANAISIVGSGVTVAGTQVGALWSHDGINIVTKVSLTVGAAIDAIGVDPAPFTTGAPFNYDIPSTGYVDANGNSAALDDSLMIGTLSGSITLSKIGSGQLILPNTNTYTSFTDINDGWITVGQSGSLGAGAPNVTVAQGAALHLLQLSGNMTLTNNITLTGDGIADASYPLVNEQGALMSLTGINTISGNIALDGQAGIGVEQIYQYGNAAAPNFANPAIVNVASQLTLTGNQTGINQAGTNLVANPGFETGDFSGWTETDPSGFTFVGSDNPHTGNFEADLGPTIVPPGGTLSQNIVTIPGEAYTFSWFLNASGFTPSSFEADWDGTSIFSATNLPNLGYVPYSFTETATSALTSIEFKFSDIPAFADLDDVSVVPTLPVNGGLDKLGSQRLILEGPGTYIGNVNVKNGVLLDQNTTGLGASNSTGTVTVSAGAALELANDLASENGGISAGIEVGNQPLVLNGTGDPLFGDASPLVILPPSNNVTSDPFNPLAGPVDSPIINTEAEWRGPVSVNTNLIVQFQNALDGVSQPTLTIDTTNLGTTAPLPPVVITTTTAGGLSPVTNTLMNDAQDIVFTAPTDGAITGGTFTLSVGSVTTNPITWNPDSTILASEIQSALAALSYTVTGSITDATNPASPNPIVITTTSTAGLSNGQTVTISGVNGDTSANGTYFAEVLSGTSFALFKTFALGVFSNPVIGNNPYTGGGTWKTTLAGTGNVTVTQTGIPLNVGPNSRLTLFGNIDDNASPFTGGADLNFSGGGELTLAGTNTYRGTTSITAGVVTIENSQALGEPGISAVQTLTVGTFNSPFFLSFNGDTTTTSFSISGNAAHAAADAAAIQTALNALTSISGVAGSVTVSSVDDIEFTITFDGNLDGFVEPNITSSTTAATVVTTNNGAGGTIVANGASLQLQGNITVGGEPLLVDGQGVGTTPDVPQQWFSVGPAPTTDGQTEADQNVSGEVTSVVVDPSNSSIIFIATGGGGVWKTIDGGLSWHPVFDAIPDIQTVTDTLAAGTFTLTFIGPDSTGNTAYDTTAPIPFNATQEQLQNALNALPNIGGAGGDVTVVLAGNVYTINFGGTLTGQAITTLVSSNALVKTAVVETAANETPEIDTIDDETGGTGVGKFDVNFTAPDITGTTVTDTVNVPFGVTAAVLQADLNAFSNIGGVGGSVGVTLAVDPTDGDFIYTITYGGNLDGQALAQPGTFGAPDLFSNNISIAVDQFNFVSTSQFGSTQPIALFCGTLTFDNTTQDLFLGTGSTNSSSESYYGTGVYETKNLGVTWTLLTDNVTTPGAPFNPLVGLGVSQIAVDTTVLGTGVTLYAAVGDGFNGVDEIETLNTDLVAGDQFTISFTGPNALGVVVNDTTAVITYAGNSVAQLNTDIARISAALNAAVMTNIAGVGGSVLVSLDTNPAPGYTEAFDLTFNGALQLKKLNLVTTSDPIGPPGILVTELQAGGPPSDVNGAIGGCGVWRFTTVTVAGVTTSTWFNMTDVISPNRATLDGKLAAPPDTPGPDDDFRLSFPQSGATWSSVALTYADATNDGAGPAAPGIPVGTPIIFAALGTPGGGGNLDNAVYWCANPTSDAPIWYIGDPGKPANEVQTFTITENGSEPPAKIEFLFQGNGPAPGQATGLLSFTLTNQTATIQALINAGWANVPGFVVGDVTVANTGNTVDSETYTLTFSGGMGLQSWPLVTALLNPAGNPNFTFTNAITTAGGGADTRNNEFPIGNFATGLPINGTIELVTVPGAKGAGGPVQNSITVYAVVTTPQGQINNIFVSTAGGRGWKAIASLPPGYLGAEGSYDNSIFLVPNGTLGAATLIVGGLGTEPDQTGEIWETNNSGGAWTDLSVADPTGYGPHASVHSIFALTNGLGTATQIFVGTDGGLWELNTGTAKWSDLNGDLATAQVNSVAVDPGDPTTVYAAMNLDGIQETLSTNTQNWAELDTTDYGNAELGASQIYVDPTNPLNLYAVMQELNGNAVLIGSVNGGVTWTSVTTPLLNLSDANGPVVLDQVNPARLLAGVGLNVLESEDNGASFPTILSPDLPNGDVASIAIAEYQGTFQADPGFSDVTDQGANAYDPNTIYVTDGTNIEVTKDGGQTWVDRSIDSDASIVQLVVDPRNENTVYAVCSNLNDAVGGQIWKSIDAGQDWFEIGTDDGLPLIPAWTLVIDPVNNNLYVGTDDGVYELQGGGALGTTAVNSLWQRLGVGMPDVQVRALELDDATQTLTAGTDGRGVFQLSIDNTQGIQQTLNLSALDTELNSGLTPTFNLTIPGIGQSAPDITYQGPNAQDDFFADNNFPFPYTPAPSDALNIQNALNGLLAGSGGSGPVTSILSATGVTPIVIQTTPALTANLFNGETVTVAGATGDTNANGVWTIGSLNTAAGTFQLTGSITGAAYTGGGIWSATPGTVTVTVDPTDTVFTISFQGGIKQSIMSTPIVLTDTTNAPTLVITDATVTTGSAFVATGGSATWTGPVILAGPTTIGVNGTQFEQNAVDAAQLAIQGTISDLVAGSTANTLTKIGFGQLTFGGADTYAGQTLVEQGELVVDNPLALSGLSTTVFSGAALDMETSVSNEEPLFLNGDGVPFDGHNTGALDNIADPNTYNGTITLDTNSTIGVVSGSSLTIGDGLGDGTITDNGAGFDLVKELTGTLVFADANSYGGTTPFNVVVNGVTIETGLAGGTLVSQGVLNVENSAALNAWSATPTVPASIPATTTTVLDGAQLQLQDSEQILTLVSPTLGPPATTFTLTLNNGTTAQTTRAITYTGNPVTDALAIQTQLNLLATIGAIVSVTGTTSGANEVFTVLFNSLVPGTPLPVLTAAVATSSATATVTGGIAIPATEGLRISGTGKGGTGVLQNVGGNNTWAGSVVLAKDPGFGPTTIPATNVSIDVQAINATDTADNLTITGVISTAGASVAGLDKIDTGVLILNPTGGSNTYTGTTNVIAGDLRVQQNGALGAGAPSGPPAGVSIAASNDASQGYAGIDFGASQGFVPPDTQGAVGPSSYVETTNQEVALFRNKNTGAGEISTPLATFFAGLPTADAGGTFSDPVVEYDDNIPGETSAADGRFIILDQNVDENTGKSVLDVAISTTASPNNLTTDWDFFNFRNDEPNGGGAGVPLWDDYPGNFGYNQDAVVVTFNMFNDAANGGGFAHAQIDAISIAALLSDTALTVGTNVFLTDNAAHFSLRPAAEHDAAAGAPMWLVTDSASANSIDVIEMTNILSAHPGFATTTLAVTPFDAVVPPLNPDGSAITTNIDDRIQKVALEGNTLVAAQAVGEPDGTQDDIQWYVIAVSGAPTLSQEGDISGGNNTYDVFPAIDINPLGVIAIGYTQSGTDSPTDFMSMYVTGRLPTDPVGTMETPILVPAGTGVQVYSDFSATGREGDLSAINVDPVNGTFWAADEFADSELSFDDGGGADWGTAIANFELNPPGPVVVSATVDSGATLQLDGSVAGPLTIPSVELTLNGSGFNNAGALENMAVGGVSANNDNTWTGSVTLASSTSIGVDGNSTLNVTGNVGDSGATAPATAPSLTKFGNGELIFAGANTYTSNTILNAGTLNISNNTALGSFVDDVQDIRVTGPLTGTFALTFTNGQTNVTSTTVSLPVGSSAALVQAALNDPVVMPSITAGGGSVSVAFDAVTGIYTVTFDGGPLAGQTQLPIAVLDTSVSPGTTAVTTKVQDGSHGTVVNPTVVQTITVGPPPQTGKFQLSLGGATTGQLDVTDPNLALDMQTALNGLTTVSTSGAITGATNAGPIVIATASTAGLVNGESVTIAGVVGNTNANGTWTIAGVTATSFQLIDSAGNAAYVSGGTWTLAGSVSVTSSPSSVTPGATIYTITFGGSLADSFLPSLTVTDSVGTPSVLAGSPGAALQIQGGITPASGNLTLDGTGINSAGALENVSLSPSSNNNGWASTITLAGNASIGADGAADVLAITGTINDINPYTGASSGFALDKVGPGTVLETNLTGAVTGASNASPIVITTPSTAGLFSGEPLSISNVNNDTNANGNFFVQVIDGTHFALFQDAGLTIPVAGNGTGTTGSWSTELTGTVSNASNTSPLVISTASTTGLFTGEELTIANVGGNAAANGTFFIGALTPTSFSLFQDAALTIPVSGLASGAYTAGGTWTADALNNTYTGLTSVTGGTLQLGRAGATTVDGNLTVGDGVSAEDTDKVEVLQNNQIVQTATVDSVIGGIFKVGNATNANVAQTVATVNATSGDVKVAGDNSTLTVATLTETGGAGLGNVIVSGNTSELIVTGTMTNTGGGVSLSGPTAELNAQGNLTDTSGSVSLSGANSELVVAGTLTEMGDTVSLTGTSSQLLANGKWTETGSAISLSGTTETAQVTGTLGMTAGSINLATGDALVLQGNVTASATVSGSVTNASNTTPIVITTASTAGLANGDQVTITGVIGNTNANSTFTIAGVTPTSFTLVGSSGNGAYFSGGTWTAIVPATINGAGTVNMAPLAVGSGTTFTVAGPTSSPEMVIGATIAGTDTGGLIQDGPGVLQLTGTETYTGPTVINGGVLQVDGSVVSSSGVAPHGATLSGNGMVGLVSNGGTIQPGDNATSLGNGTLTINPGASTETLDNTSTLRFLLNAPDVVPGVPTPTNHSVLAVNGDLNLDGVNLDVVIPSSVLPGASFTIITWTGSLNPSGPEASFTVGGATIDASSNTFVVGGEAFQVSFNSNSIVLTRVLNSTTLTLDPVPTPVSVYGEDVQFTAVMTPEAGTNFVNSATDTVTFTLTDPLLSSPITETVFLQTDPNAGTTDPAGSLIAIFDPQSPSVGNLTLPIDDSYVVSASYSGDTNFASAVATPLTSVEIDADPTILANIAPTGSLVYGQALTLNATITPAVPPTTPGALAPTGTPSFFIDNINVGSGSITQPPASGDVVTASLPSSSFSGGITLPLNAGPHSVLAVYLGDSNYSGSATLPPGLNLNIVPDSLVLSVQPASGSIQFGSAQPSFLTVTITDPLAATDTGTPDGTLSFNLGTASGLQLGQITNITSFTGPFTLAIDSSLSSLLPVGAPDTIVVSYTDANGNYTASPVSTTVNVNKAPPTVTVTSVSNPTTDVFGQALTFTATVIPSQAFMPTPTGTVTFSVLTTGTNPVPVPLGMNQTVTLSGQVATLSVPSANAQALKPGTYTVVATYTPAVTDPDYISNSSTTAPTSTNTLQVSQDPAAATISSSAPVSVFGQSVTFTATITSTAPGSGTPQGAVQFQDGASNIGSPVTVVNGVATLSTAALTTAGSPHTITAVFTDTDGDYTNPVTAASLSQTVNKSNSATSVAITTVGPFVFGEPLLFTATVTASGLGVGTPTGTVTFFDGGNLLGTGTLSGGVATFNTSSLSAPLAVGSHSISASYGGDGNFTTSASSAKSLTVGLASASVTVSSNVPHTSLFGVNVPIQATVTASGLGAGIPTGTVSFFDNGVLIAGSTTTLSGGTATFNDSSLPSNGTIPGLVHTITASYSGDGDFNSVAQTASTPLTQTVTQDSTTTSLLVNGSTTPASVNLGQLVTMTATVASNTGFGGTPTGTVKFFDGGTLLTGGTITLVGGVATFSTSSLASGIHHLTAQYQNSTDFSVSTSSQVNETVLATSSVAVGSSVNPSVFGQSVNLTATVTGSSGTPTGTANFFDGANQIGTNVPLIGGVATLSNISNLTVGAHTITAVYSGDAVYAGSTSPANFHQTVNQATATTATPTPSATPPVTVPTLFGQAVTFTTTVTSPNGTPSGTVSFFDGATQLTGSTTAITGGSASFSTSSLAGGTHLIIAQYSGDTNFFSNQSSALIYTVGPDVTAMSLSGSTGSSTTSSSFGQAVTFTASVSNSTNPAAVPTGGSVTFSDGALILGTASLVNGTAQVTTSILPVNANQTITATYTGVADFATIAGTTPWTVTPATTSTTLSATVAGVTGATASTLGQSVTLTATVGNPSGGTTPSGGTVTFTETLSGNPTPITLGSPVTLVNGTASLSTTSLVAGAGQTITANYSGFGNFGSSTGSILPSFTVNQAGTTRILTSSANPSVFGSNVVFTATISAVAPGSGVPTGSVTFSDESGPLVGTETTNVINGNLVAAFTTSTLPVSATGHTVVATYTNVDGNFVSGSSNTVTQIVSLLPASSTSLTTAPTTGVFGQPLSYTAKVTEASGTPTGTVQFVFTNTSTSTVVLTSGSITLNGSGTASFTTPGTNAAALPVGSYSVTAVYSGISGSLLGSTSPGVSLTIGKASTTPTVTASPNPVNTTTSVTYMATVTAIGGSTAVPTGTVNFFDASISTTVPLNSTPIALVNGTATFNAGTLSIGAHAITVQYTNSDGQFVGTNEASAAFTENVTGLVTQLAVQPVGSPAQTGTTTNPIKATVLSPFTLAILAENSSGTTISTFTGSASITLTSVSAAGDTMNGTPATVSFVNGVASFSLKCTKAGTYTVKITVAGLPTITVTIVAS